MRFPIIITLAAAVIAACDNNSSRQAVAATGAPAAAGNAVTDSLIPGTPPGDLGEWVADIRNGIAGVPKLVASDAAAAQRAALDLYVTRQEYAEMYYGVDGRIRAGEEL